jgi:hypothetical protein
MDVVVLPFCGAAHCMLMFWRVAIFDFRDYLGHF